jgi:N-acetylglucosaminyldiphosphoundecaprenol N-acetyl-beta-D-mannosaminyltransferase
MGYEFVQTMKADPSEPPPEDHPQVDLCGITLTKITESQCVKYVLDELGAGRGGWVVTPNLDILRQVSQKPELRELVGEATMRVADGMPLIWAAKLQGTPLPERVAGSTLIGSLSAAAAERGRSVYLLGGDEGTAAAAAAVLVEKYPNLRVAGTYYPPMGFEQDEDEMRCLRTSITESRPDIVFVALGFPKQERLIRMLRPLAPGAWWLGVGISFSFLCGRVRRAPVWMQKCGLEWVHRMAQEPGRLIRRYLIDDIPFAVGLIIRSLSWRFRG